ncbi:MAG TPA: hypothetical protein PLM14_10645 [Candidatus Hydrogenedentes bacterium]|nr:hypothetical protein [Candidatus Hydrogenedentota bacterium]HQH51092.1 hypothetical protein [Candidatus Hydrogenedentota bacterium]
MSTSPPQFPAYGDRGDLIGARRARWSFRFCVTACVILMISLWLSEYFIGFERAENLYLSALTKHEESARPLLRQAVMRDKAASESPNPRYLQALAERELEDEVLPVYEEAFELDPGNAMLALRYGCRLFTAGKFEEARERFRDAARNAPDNALPSYLEATTIPWTLQDEANILQESLKLIAQANSSGKQIVFPRPLWHPKLPQQGSQYAQLRREVIDECLAPVMRYEAYITLVARRHMEEGHTQYWDSWLQTLGKAGDRIARSALSSDGSGDTCAGSAAQAMIGLDLWLQTVRLRQGIQQTEKGHPDDALAQREAELSNSLGILRDFENSRQPVIERDTNARQFACFAAPFFAVLALGVFSCATAFLARCIGANRNGWAIAHGLRGSIMMAVCALALGLFIAASPWFQQTSETDIVPILRHIWLLMLGATAVAGLLYPMLVLVNPRKAAEETGHDAAQSPERTAAATARWRAAYILMIRRFLGTTLGLFLCVFSVWAILHRLVAALYPWQIPLLATGMGSEEALAVRNALSLLH